VTFSLALRPVVSGKGNGLLERFGLHRGRASLQLHQDAVGLVGTPGEIADAVLDHYDIGIDHFVLHGSDAAGLIPLIRRKVARRKAELNIVAG
jgi:alkanesulfonate monooxygenase SsuD/methylene tetrahydromethanopterin reductase-like flavin-dependent oxidoreductase (luciferase family)